MRSASLPPLLILAVLRKLAQRKQKTFRAISKTDRVAARTKIMLKQLKEYRRIVVKIGSALLVDRASGLKRQWLEGLGQDIAALHHAGGEVLVVSSGAIALGRTVLGLPKKALKLEESQAAAAAGQIALAKAYADVLGGHGIKSGQILVTLSDTEERRRYLNARATIDTLLKLKA